MALTTTFVPQYPLPARPTRITIASNVSGCNFLRLFATSAPPGSRIRAKLDGANGEPVEEREMDNGDTWLTNERDFDVGGVYTFSVDEIVKGATTHGGGWHNSPDADQTETIGGTSTLTVYMGTRLEMELGIGAETAKLAFYVWSDTIRATELPEYPEKTPTVTDPRGQRGAVAASSSVVLSAAAALSGVTASTAAGSAATGAADLIEEFDDHRIESTVHSTDDTDNDVEALYETPGTLAEAVVSLNRLRALLIRHMENDDGGGVGAVGYHAKIGSHPVLAPECSADDPASVVLLWADLYRVYVGHKEASGVHAVPDTGNDPNALPALIEVQRQFLTIVASPNPTAPATEHSGATLLMAATGITKAA